MITRASAEELTVVAGQNRGEREFWLEKCAGDFKKSRFPSERQETVNYTGGYYEFGFSKETAEGLLRLSKGSDYSLNLVLVTIVMLLLHKYTGEEKISMGSPIYKQEEEGAFINTVLLLQQEFHEELTLKECLTAVGKTIKEAVANQNFPLELIPEMVELDHSYVGFDLFDVALLLENIHHESYIDHLQFNLLFSFIKENQDIRCRMRYNSEAYSESYIEQLSRHLQSMTASMLLQLDARLGELTFLPGEEAAQLARFALGKEQQIPQDQTVHGIFTEQAHKRFDATAISSPLDVSGIFNYLEKGGETDAALVSDLAAACFRSNPFITEYPLTHPQYQGELYLVKTHHHNSVVINGNLRVLLSRFNGQANLDSIYRALQKWGNKKEEPVEFIIFSMEKSDLLEVTFRFSPQPRRFVVREPGHLYELARSLENNHLMELVDIKEQEEPGETCFIAGDFSYASLKGDISLNQLLTGIKEVTPAPVLLLGDTPGIPTTGLLYLASYLKRQNIDCYCRFYDSNLDFSSMKGSLEELLTHIQPAIVALSLKWFPYISRVLELAKLIKDYALRAGVDIKVVVGGNTASYYREEIIGDEAVDILVCGDGEEALFAIARGEENPPNCLIKKEGKVVDTPFDYIQGENNSQDIYLSHLQEILLSPNALFLGTFFIYTHKGCAMNCLYCGGCRDAQQHTFNRSKIFRRGISEVRKDLLEAAPLASAFQFDFDRPDDSLVEYCRQIWEGIDLTSHFCIITTLNYPSPELIQLVSKTFKYVYWDYDIGTLSQRHRKELYSRNLIKPLPGDEDIFLFMDRCEQSANIQVRLNLINGLPLFTLEDMESGKDFIKKVMRRYRNFGELHWARLHAQPGAPILDHAEEYGMDCFARTYEDFVKFSQQNFNAKTSFPGVENLVYPYIYYKDDGLNSKVTGFFLDINREIGEHKKRQRRNMLIHKTITYSELDRQSDLLAGAILEKGVQPGEIVGIMLGRSPSIPRAILAVLKTGCAYMPMDPEFPVRRMAYMLQDSSSPLLITSLEFQSTLEQLGNWQGRVLYIEDTPETGAGEFNRPPVQPGDPAYVIYTSGTTGKPKGVLLSHDNLVNYLHWFAGEMGLRESDKTALTSSFAFDLGYTSLFSSLLWGCQLHILPREIYLSGESFPAYIKDRQITYLKVTPSLFANLVNSASFNEDMCGSLRFAAVGGEAIVVEDLKTAHERCPDLRIINHYGPTEATIGSVATAIDFKDFDNYRENPAIGRPISNAAAYIMNKAGQLLPPLVPGELCLSGRCLARGYMNHPLLTGERFIRYREEKIYRTGDLALWLPDGNIKFLGRIDQQVKLRGYRIELGEIESRLGSHAGVKEALVIVRDPSEDKDPANKIEKYLCAYLVTDQGNGKQSPGQGVLSLDEIAQREGLATPRIGKGNLLEVLAQKSACDTQSTWLKAGETSYSYGEINRESTGLAQQIIQSYRPGSPLSKAERSRYKRQLLLHEWGMSAQEKLKQTTVFVAGAGGGASPTIMQLALAGFGTLVVCDCDVVELSNLNRQFLHDESRIGMNKALSAQMTIKKVNPNVKVIPITERLTRENVFQLVGNAAVIFDMFDGQEDKFILSECATAKGIPHIVSAMTDINGYTAVFHTPHTPCFHCLYDSRKLSEIREGMSRITGKYEKNPLPVVATSLFMSTAYGVNEAIKIILGFQNPSYNKFLYFNQRGISELSDTLSFRAMTYTFSDHFLQLCKDQGFDWEQGWRGRFLEELEISPDSNCSLCGPRGEEKRAALKEKLNEQIPHNLEEDINKSGVVALLVKPGAGFVTGFLAIIKAGKTAVLLDPDWPEPRMEQVLTDSGARLILSSEELSKRAEMLGTKVNKNIGILSIESAEGERGEASSLPGSPGENPLYLLYGSENPGEDGEEEILVETYRSLTSVAGYFAQELEKRNDESGKLTASYGINGMMIDIFALLFQGKGPYEFKPKATAIAGDSLANELRFHLKESLPEYMVPAHFVELEQIPLTPNGKVDRRSLPEPAAFLERQIIPPANPVEKKLAEIWDQVLGLDNKPISVDESFFALGGHSLNATIMVSRVHKELDVKIPLETVFKYPTIQGLAGEIGVTGETAYTTIEANEEKEYYPMSSAQKRMYLLYQMKQGADTSDNTPVVLTARGDLDRNYIEFIVKHLIKRHDTLRTSFQVVENNAVQRVHREVEFHMEYHKAIGPEQGVGELVKAFIRPFDLSQAPLLRAGLIEMPGKNFVLMYDMHHIIVDDTSSGIFIQEFMNLYNGMTLPPLNIQYKDFTLWQNGMLETGGIKRSEAYWLELFSGSLPQVDLPTDFPRPPVQSFAGDLVETKIQAHIKEGIDNIARECGATFFMVWFAIYNILLSKYSGREDIVVGIPIAGRAHAELGRLIGMFVNTLAMRNFPQGHKSFIQFLEELAESSLKAFEHQDYQFEELVNKLGIKPGLDRNPLFDTMFAAVQDTQVDIGSREKAKSLEGLSFRPYEFEEEITQFDIIIHAYERGNHTAFELRYSTALFKRETMELFMEHYREIAEIVAKNPEVLIKDISISLGFSDSDSSILADAQSDFGF